MNRTKIEWCDYTINPVKGLCPMACDFCYARRMYKRFKWPEKVRWWPEAWDLVDTLKKPSRVFVGSTFELFHESLPYNWMEYNLLTAKKYPQHTFIFLTKCPQNLVKFSPFPDNAWVGVTVCNAEMFLPATDALDSIEASIKYVSFEPLLENPAEFCEQWSEDLNATIDWLIIGACTGNAWDAATMRDKYPDLTVARYGVKWVALPKIEWLKEIVEAADRAGVKVFLKDNLESLLPLDSLFYTQVETNGGPEYRLRQELPV